MLPVEALRSFNVMFATPMNRGGDPIYIASLYGLSGDCVKAGMNSRLEIHPDADPIRARNAILRRFLADESFTHLFWIDSDVGASSSAVFRLLLADKDIAVGVPPIKQLPMVYPFFPIDDHADEDGFCRTYSAVTGFMCVKRSVFTTMMQKYPHYRYTPDGPLGKDHPEAHLHWRFYDNMICPTTGRYLTEDYAFCRLWTDMGGEIYADVHSSLTHQGSYLYRGNLMAHLEAKGALEGAA